MLEVVVHTQGARRAVQAQSSARPRLLRPANVGRASGLHSIETWTTPFQAGGSFPVASSILDNQSGGPIMSPALSISNGLPWAIRPVVTAAPAIDGARDSCGCGCRGSASPAAPVQAAGLFDSIPWWGYVAGGLLLMGTVK